MKQWINTLKSKLAAFASRGADEAAWQETAAMVYVGDIYAVLLHDRAARRQARGDYPAPERRDASWPFIR